MAHVLEQQTVCRLPGRVTAAVFLQHGSIFCPCQAAAWASDYKSEGESGTHQQPRKNTGSCRTCLASFDQSRSRRSSKPGHTHHPPGLGRHVITQLPLHRALVPSRHRHAPLPGSAEPSALLHRCPPQIPRWLCESSEGGASMKKTPASIWWLTPAHHPQRVEESPLNSAALRPHTSWYLLQAPASCSLQQLQPS